MNNIKFWREKAFLTQQEMSCLLEIPKRTIENWETDIRKPPVYVEKLVVEKLMRITEEVFVKKANKYAATLKSDENGNRPVGSWCVVTSNGYDEFVDLYENMQSALDNIADGYVAYILCNKIDKGLEAFYTDKNNVVHSDCNIIKF